MIGGVIGGFVTFLFPLAGIAIGAAAGAAIGAMVGNSIDGKFVDDVKAELEPASPRCSCWCGGGPRRGPRRAPQLPRRRDPDDARRGRRGVDPPGPQLGGSPPGGCGAGPGDRRTTRRARVRRRPRRPAPRAGGSRAPPIRGPPSPRARRPVEPPHLGGSRLRPQPVAAADVEPRADGDLPPLAPPMARRVPAVPGRPVVGDRTGRPRRRAGQVDGLAPEPAHDLARLEGWRGSTSNPAGSR